MKIVEVKSYILQASLDTPFFFSQPGIVSRRSSMVVELVTDEGISGFGESLCHGLQPPEIARATLESCLKELILHRDPFDVGVLFEQMYNRTKDFGQKGAVIGAISAVDIALWDLLGKALNKPVHKLLGGSFRTSVEPYATGFYRQEGMDDGALVEEALAYKAKGFRGMKVKIGFGVARDLRLAARIREAVGSEVRLMLDANHAYNASIARRLVRELDPMDIYWLEEPISPEDVDGYVELRQMAPRLLLAAGEDEFTRYGFWPWVVKRAVDVLQPDIAAGGGFTGLKEITTLSQAAGMLINPHVWGTAIGLAASLQFLAVVPPNPISRGQTEPLLEYDQSAHPFRRELVENPVELVDGMVPIPQGPGIGAIVNRAVLEQYSR